MRLNKINARNWVILLLLSYIFLFHAIGDYSLKEPDEGRYAEIPREMIESGDYIVPHLNYVRYFEKPPLFYWATALSYKIFGVSEWSFRFTNSFSAFLCVIFLYIYSRRLFTERVAFLSSLILLSSFGFFSMARIVTIDMFFTLWLFLSIISFLVYYKKGQVLFVYLFYAFIALATLSKGIVSPILTGFTVFLFLLTEKRLSFLKEMRLPSGIALYLVITVPWFLSISLIEKEFFFFFFIDQHFLRFFTTKHKRSGSMLYFFPVLAGGMFPWSIFIPRAVAIMWKKNELRLLFIWSCVVFGFFSVSGSKLPPYILPIFPALSILLGHMFSEKWDRPDRLGIEKILYILVFSLFVLGPFLYKNPLFVSWINLISTEAMGVFESLRPFSIAMAIASLIVVIALILVKKHVFSNSFILFNAFSFLFVIAILFNIDVINSLNTTKRLSETINRDKEKIDCLINYGSLDQTLIFYTKRRVIIAAYKGELLMGSKYDDARSAFIDEKDFFNIFNSDKRVYAVMKIKRLNRVKDRLPNSTVLIGCQSERCLLRNR